MSVDPIRIVQFWSPEKDAEFAGMTPVERLAWLDQVRLLLWASASSVSDGKPPRP